MYSKLGDVHVRTPLWLIWNVVIVYPLIINLLLRLFSEKVIHLGFINFLWGSGLYESQNVGQAKEND